MNPSDIEISVVLPAYKCSFFIDEIYERLCAVLHQIGKSYEIIFINDSSPEEDWNIIKKLAKKDKRVIGINFSRNFGQHYAIFAGLERSSGNWVVVMDCDLQDRPEEIKKIYDKAITGYDIVLAKRNNRKDFILKKIY